MHIKSLINIVVIKCGNEFKFLLLWDGHGVRKAKVEEEVHVSLCDETALQCVFWRLIFLQMHFSSLFYYYWALLSSVRTVRAYHLKSSQGTIIKHLTHTSLRKMNQYYSWHSTMSINGTFGYRQYNFWCWNWLTKRQLF